MANFPTVVNPADLAGALAGSQIQETAGGGQSYLKIDFETGEWLLGAEGNLVTNEDILINTPSIQHGWILWSGGRPQKKFVGFIHALPVPMDAIGPDVPSEARSMQAAMVDDGEMVSFDTNSYGGRKGVDTLLGKIKAHSAEGSQYLYPKVTLTSESYANAKRGGKLTYNPVFEIVAWCDQNGSEEEAAQEQLAAAADDSATGAEAEAPVRQKRKRRAKAAV